MTGVSFLLLTLNQWLRVKPAFREKKEFHQNLIKTSVSHSTIIRRPCGTGSIQMEAIERDVSLCKVNFDQDLFLQKVFRSKFRSIWSWFVHIFIDTFLDDIVGYRVRVGAANVFMKNCLNACTNCFPKRRNIPRQHRTQEARLQCNVTAAWCNCTPMQVSPNQCNLCLLDIRLFRYFHLLYNY